MIEPVLMDYEGEPVIIEDGKIYDVEPPQILRRIYLDSWGEECDSEYEDAEWNSQKCEWEEPDDPVIIPYEKPYYELSYSECNSDMF